MGDLFHESVPLEFIESVFFAIGVATQHTYQILTKRPERMKKVIDYLTYKGVSMRPNVWLGVTAENQEQADKRIPILLDTPAERLTNYLRRELDTIKPTFGQVAQIFEVLGIEIPEAMA